MFLTLAAAAKYMGHVINHWKKTLMENMGLLVTGLEYTYLIDFSLLNLITISQQLSQSNVVFGGGGGGGSILGSHLC